MIRELLLVDLAQDEACCGPAVQPRRSGAPLDTAGGRCRLGTGAVGVVSRSWGVPRSSWGESLWGEWTCAVGYASAGPASPDLRSNDFCGDRRKGHTEHLVSAGDEQVLLARHWPDDGQPVGGHGAQPGPAVGARCRREVGHVLVGRADDAT